MKKVILTILDGYGLRDDLHGNAIKQANTDTFDYLWNNYPHSKLIASGREVGLPNGQMGNSETGHLNIGAGRIVYQPLETINKSIEDNSISNNKVLLKVFEDVKENNKRLQIVGLVSDGGVHSHINHLKNILDMANNNGVNNIYMHLITDGRDTLYDSGINYVKEIASLNIGKISTICGRYYTMDRDNNWDRTDKAFNLMVDGVGSFYKNIDELFNKSYSNKIYDEFIAPSIIDKDGLIKDDDYIIWFNFRKDRSIQILTKLKEFNSNIITMFNVSDSLNLNTIFNNDNLYNTLGDYLSSKGLRQLRIAETEKYAHVTYFFDGGVNKDINGCDRILIPSPKVKTYDLKPEMSAFMVTNRLLEVMNEYDVIILNFANPDMLGHTGNIDATIKGIEYVDSNLKLIYDKAISLGFTLIVTADHGNAEYMLDDNNNVITSHTTNKVPFIVCDKNISLKDGILSDIAPTILDIIGLDKPNEMTGNSLKV